MPVSPSVRARIGCVIGSAIALRTSVGITPISSSIIAVLVPPVFAQTVIPDGSLTTAVSQDGALNQFVVTGGSAQGGNLFHSFESFSPAERSVLFDLSGESFGAAIERVFSRVTGSDVSEINSSLSIVGGNSPDLFLLNPNGIVFGRNARLNLPGSFVSTTAENIQFADGLSFGTVVPPNSSLLAISVPTGLQFGRNPGAISVLGTGSNIQPRSIPIATPPLPDQAFPEKGLSVAPGNTLALLGGPIQFDGGEVQSLSILRPDGNAVPLGGLQLELGSVGAGLVGLAVSPLGWTADYSEVQSYEDILFSNQSWLNNGGINPSSISITGRNISGEGASTISLLNFGPEKNGDITLRASDHFQFSGSGFQSSDIENSALSSGDGGNVNLFANSLALADGSRLQASSYSEGNSGDMTVQVNGDIHLNGLTDISNPVPNLTVITAATTGQGNAGEVRVTARNITLENGALISSATFATGKSNNVTLNVEDSIVVRGVNPISFVNSNITSSSFAAGDTSGRLKINTASLEVLEGGLVVTSTFGTSDAGEIIINASDYVRVGGFSMTPNEPFTSRIISDAVEGGLALDVFAERLPLTGDAGSISITTPRLEVFDQGQISVTNRGSGGAGDLSIVTESLSLSGQAEVLAETELGLDGDISLVASESILLEGQSKITASSNGDQRGGNINIETQHLVAFPNSNSDIRADAANSLGGNITIDATSILGFNLRAPASEQTNDITASSALGTESNGTIELSQPSTDPVSGVTVLNDTLSQSDETLIANDCSAPSTSFAHSGRGGLPLGPNDLLDDRRLVEGKQDPINQAIALRDQGLYAKALTLLLDETGKIDDLATTNTNAKFVNADLQRQAIAFRQLGITQKLLEQYGESQISLKHSLSITQRLGNNEQSSATLLSLGNLARAQGNTSEARSRYINALAQRPSPKLSAQILANQLSLALEERNLRAAQRIAHLLLERFSENVGSELHLATRLNVAATVLRHQQTDIIPNFLMFLHQDLADARAAKDSTAIAYALGHLGRAFEQQEQWDKAQAFSEAALQQAQMQQDKLQEYQWAWQLGRSFAQQWEQSQREAHQRQARSAYQIALDTLGQLRSDLATVSPTLQFSFQSQVEPIYREFVGLLLANPSNKPKPTSTANLKQALETIEALRVAELDNFFQDACLKATPRSIETLDAAAAVIYPIILDDRLEVIVSHQGLLQHHTVPVDAQQLEKTARVLERNLKIRSRRSYRQSSQQLYDWLIRPIANQLEAAGIETLVFVPDAPLRNIPMTALSDGEQYLIEQFKVAIAPSLQLLPAQRTATIPPQALVAGITQQRQGFSSLPYVEQEIDNIQALFPGKQLVNDAFTPQAFEQSLLETQTPIVHIATHGQFSSSADETFILAWDEQISIDQLRELLEKRDLQNLTPTELLVLSACETAVGDEFAALGLAGMAVRAGARSTLASLWSVNDQSTARFMETFYQQLAQSSTTKAAALQGAQLAMLEDPVYRHPYYWSAFSLMGNWQ